MSQNRKPTFSLYTSLYATSAARTRKAVGKPFRKLSDREVISKAFDARPDLCRSADAMVMAHDVFWLRKGRHTVYLNDDDVVRRLMSARFDVSAGPGSGLSFPFESFRIALPKGTRTPTGQELPGIQVTWLDYEAFVPEVVESFFGHIDLGFMPTISNIDHAPGERALVVNMLLDATNLESMHTVILEHQLPLLLAATDFQEFQTQLGDFSDAALSFASLTEMEQEKQFAAIRLVCALGVFNAATEDEFLAPGFPGGQPPRTVGGSLGPRMSHHVLTMPPLERGSVGTHYRAAHFHQLRHDRYYQGEYAAWPRGSRWAFVKDTWVNTDHQGAEES